VKPRVVVRLQSVIIFIALVGLGLGLGENLRRWQPWKRNVALDRHHVYRAQYHLDMKRKFEGFAQTVEVHLWYHCDPCSECLAVERSAQGAGRTQYGDFVLQGRTVAESLDEYRHIAEYHRIMAEHHIRQAGPAWPPDPNEAVAESGN
jgi:hypothetical protein